jgi:chromosome segregation ATPase
MKFPRFYNPFARIRSLQAEIADVTESRDGWREIALDNSDTAVRLSRKLDGANQALDAHMAERAELKETTSELVAVGIKLATEVRIRDEAGIALCGELIAAKLEVQSQAEETLEVVDYVKQVEAVLANAGITIEDNDQLGPIVILEEAKVSAVKDRLVELTDRDRGYFAVLPALAAQPPAQAA